MTKKCFLQIALGLFLVALISGLTPVVTLSAERSWLGVSVNDLTDDIISNLKLPPGTKGVMVSNVMPGGPAEKAGLKIADVIQMCDNKKIETAKDLAEIIAKTQLGKVVPLLVLRQDITLWGRIYYEPLSLMVTLGKIEESKLASMQAATDKKADLAAPAEKLSVSAPKSDVDELPLVKTQPNKNSYAIVIGIEIYRQKLPKADFAAHDAKIVLEYLTRTMGYPEENVITLINDRALKSDMEKYFDRWLSNNVEENGRVFIYYSGHGAPNIKNGDAYLVPYDGDPTFIAETGYPIARLYESLGKLKAREITVVLDSCFSGAGGRSVIAKGAKPLVISINTPNIGKNIAVMTASSGDQISSAYEEKGHGLFTYFLLKGIKNEGVLRPDGTIALSDLFSYLKPQVERIARKQYNNEQTPQLIGQKASLKDR